MTDTDLQQKRLIAAAIDVGVVFVLGFGLTIGSFALSMAVRAMTHESGSYVWRLMTFLIAVVSLVYMLARDVIGGGRSLGKKSQDLRVVTSDGQPITFVDSAKRNAIFAVGSVLSLVSATAGLVPCLGDAVRCLLGPLVFLGGLASLVAAVVEIIKITQDPAGIRFGDQFARTKVIR
jgi:uncharacterized RDD family membrane protein YckC